MFCLRIAVVLIWNLGGPRVLYCLNVYIAPRIFLLQSYYQDEIFEK